MNVETEHRGALARGILAYRDILDQPKGRYIVSVDPTPMQNLVFYADEVEKVGDVIRVFVAEEKQLDVTKRQYKLVTEFAASIPWQAIASDYVDVVTTEVMMGFSAEDHKAMKELHSKLVPKDQDGPEGNLEDIAKAIKGQGQYL